MLRKVLYRTNYRIENGHKLIQALLKIIYNEKVNMQAIHDEVVSMSNRRNFDTLRYANRLKAVGVPEKQAEMQAELQAETLDKIDEIIAEKIATKRDVKELELAVGRNMKELESRIGRDMKELELRIGRDIKELELRLGGILGSIIVVGFTVLGILIKLQ